MMSKSDLYIRKMHTGTNKQCEHVHEKDILAITKAYETKTMCMSMQRRINL